jgi:hypothetical protein
MKFIAEITISVKKGYLPHITNELYKRRCEILKLDQLERGDESDLFRIRIMYLSREKFTGFIDKIEKHTSNFEIVEIQNTLEGSIVGGLLRVTGKVPIENFEDYSIHVTGATELIVEKMADENERLNYIGITRNVAVINALKSVSGAGLENFLKQYVMAERDSVIINRFSGLNALPLTIKYDHVEDLIRSIRSVENTYSVIRINYIEDDDFGIYEQIYEDVSVPVLMRSFDEIPLCLLAVIFSLSRKNNFAISENNVGVVGIDVSGVRLSRLLNAAGCQRVLGYDTNEKRMLDFEREGGFATSAENIFSNSDILVLFKEYFTIDEFYKMRPGQIVISLIDDSDIDLETISEKGLREFLHGDWMDLSVLFPGMIRGFIQSGLKSLDDRRLIDLSWKILDLAPAGALFPEIFSEVHEKIADMISRSS